MTSGRIACINPRCRRTAPADKYEPGEEIICRKCFRSLPWSIADRYRALARRQRTLLRLINKRVTNHTITAATIEAISMRMQQRREENWIQMRAFFRPVERPAGIEAFLEEMQL